ncbi:MAG: hypothetical protein IH582_02240 [Afipia sp.]|nr:hypothetical protein [Afipia sp.]
MMMYGWSDTMEFSEPTHLLFFLALIALVIYPIGRILNRIGLSPLWSVLAFIPILNLLALWIVAFSDWPNQKNHA